VAYRAGVGTIAAGTSAVTITFSSTLGTTNYAAEVTMTNHPNLAATSGWGYLSVSSQTATSITVTRYDTSGAAENAPAGQPIAFDWTAITNQ
jgi:hypothetical protein